MLLLTTPQHLKPSFTLSLLSPHTKPNHKTLFHFPMRSSAFTLLRSLSSLQRLYPTSISLLAHKYSSSLSTFVENLAPEPDSEPEEFAFEVKNNEKWDFSKDKESESFDLDGSFASKNEMQKVGSLKVLELGEVPEEWRRARLAWLCKELPEHKQGTLIRVLNAQRKWIRQDDATYVAVHCMRIRENETGFRVYKWMMQQHWFRFDFALATKLADYMGKERKCLKCREIFDDILNQGLVPSESTFHILTVAYLSSPAQGFLEEACGIYNRMMQLGGYMPRLSLHNSVFRALVSRPGVSSKHYLKQAEFIFNQLETSGLEIQKDIFGGLIWLHSYQDAVDKERISSLRREMHRVGIKESGEVLLSILRACSKEGDVEEAERTWIKLLRSDDSIPSQAFVYKMEVYARVGEPMKSLEIFQEMQQQLGSASVAAYHQIIEVLCKARNIDLAESLITEFMDSGFKPLVPSFIDLMDMYFTLSLHDKVERVFFQSLEKCRPNRTIYAIYLDSLVQIGNLDKADEIFNQMLSNETIGVNTRSCNTILKGFLSCGEYVKAEKIYDLMCQKKYDIESPLMEKLDYVLSLSKKVVKKPTSRKLSKEQREILVGMLLGGVQIESDEDRKNHTIHFEFKENSGTHYVMKRHIYDQYHEWLASFSRPKDSRDDIPNHFATVSHSYFSFYADQFWPKGQFVIPKLIHRWLSPRVMAYWYMYGGYKTSSGDILLKLTGNQEGVERIVKTLKARSLDCRVKRKGKVFWIGFLGNNASWFWKLIEPFVLDDLKDLLKAGGQRLDGTGETQNMDFDSEFDPDD